MFLVVGVRKDEADIAVVDIVVVTSADGGDGCKSEVP